LTHARTWAGPSAAASTAAIFAVVDVLDDGHQQCSAIGEVQVQRWREMPVARATSDIDGTASGRA